MREWKEMAHTGFIFEKLTYVYPMCAYRVSTKERHHARHLSVAGMCERSIKRFNRIGIREVGVEGDSTNPQLRGSRANTGTSGSQLLR